jgi:hypothetical protein
MRNFRPSGKRTISPQKAVQILQEKGTVVSEKEAEIILDFMYNFAKLSVKQALREDSREPCPKVQTPRNLFK